MPGVVYAPITNVMPVAAMVTGAVVGAALCDQIRDDLVALRSGWWFRATKSTTQLMTSSVVTTITFDTITQSDTSLADGSISIVSGSVQTTKAGLWLIGGAYSHNSLGLTESLLLSATDSTPGYFVDNNVSATVTDVSGSGMTYVTSATNSFALKYFSVASSPTIATARTALWGVFLGGAP